MKRHAGSRSSETRREKRKRARRTERDRTNKRANNVLTKNTSLAERARRRGDETLETSRRSPLFGGGAPWSIPDELAALWRKAGGGK